MAFRLVNTPRFAPYERLSPSQLQDELANKSVLITGGGKGIGAAIAKSFAEAGVSRIHISGRDQKNLNATADEIICAFPAVQVVCHVTDIVSASDVAELFQDIGTESPDVLVNNAGYMPNACPFAEADLHDWWRGFEVNILGTAQVVQAFLRHRRANAQQRDQLLPPAVVLSLNTGAALNYPVPSSTSYASSKAALARFNELLAVDVPESEARFVALHPGVVKTDMYDRSPGAHLAPVTEAKLTGDWVVWAASREADFLAGRFAWVNWDVDELVSKKEEIIEGNLLKTDLKEEKWRTEL